jgi:hypothetical protein
MAKEIKNTFLKSKMNKDLDDRILPNGEYRDARNISVGRSEDNDVGALENIIGNNLVVGTDIGNGFTVIGVHANNATDQVFVFLTDYTDPNPLQPTDAPSTSNHYIYIYNNSTGTYTSLVNGEFLNFSTTNRIISINLLENLLFWTDNRNQPRKINIGTFAAVSGQRTTDAQYYTQEHQISVAKYSPYQAIQLYTSTIVESSTNTISYVGVSGNQEEALTPFIGGTVVSSENLIKGDGFHKIISVGFNIASGDTRIIVSPSFSSVPTADTYFTFIKSTMTNKNDDADWPGDPDFLEDKFARFSYRFKYDDNEYSLMAPFTQIAYIPKQNGYFINGDENSAYQSTIVDFMENQVQNIGLVIPLPTNANRIVRDYKISELEILFRESDQVAVRVLESITAGEISSASGTDNFFTYDYQSRKPYKTLPEAETVRVYDKVPVRAFSQETSGNRIIYGNYRDQHTPPPNINYNCRIAAKSDTGSFYNWLEYPNHSVKRNRNYQVGFVLADKFGRQSPVILSSVDSGANNDGQFYFGSTIYSPYDISENDTDVLNWFGDAISVLINSEIKSTKNLSTGTPGLYAIKQNATTSSAEGFAILSDSFISDSQFTFRLDSLNYGNNNNIPRIGDYLRGAYEDFVRVTNITGPSAPQNQYVVTTSGRVNDVYLRADNLPANTPDLKFAYTINDLGWYSYKIVVKQTEQEYYNVYLPGILNGYPEQATGGDAANPVGEYNGVFPVGENNLTAFTVLFNDNINKIPRDLAEVGPEQKQFRSSVTLYGRVTNIMTTSTASNEQYYARLSSQGKNAIAHTSTAIADAKEVNMATSDVVIPTNVISPFYQLETNPLIARISTTEKSIGTTWEDGSSNYMKPFLAIYETEPVESLLDIYWETTSEGLIVDLNADVLSDFGGATDFINFSWDFDEATLTNEFVTTGYFEPVNSEGLTYGTPGDAALIEVRNGNGSIVEGLFKLYKGVGSFLGKYRIQFIGDPLIFNSSSRQIDVYTFLIQVTTNDGDVTQISKGGEIGGEGALRNITPSFNQIPSFGIARDTRVIIPAIGFTGKWATADPKNGSANSDDTNGLQYSITGSNLPASWTMDVNTGELTQNIDETAPGTYAVSIRVTDATGVDLPNGSGTQYNQLFVESVTLITVGYAPVNPEALSDDCLVNPTASGSDVITSTGLGVIAKGVWYLAENTNNLNLDSIAYGFPRFEINAGSHKSGTIVFTSNAKQHAPGGAGGVKPQFKPANTNFYYRVVGTTTWILLDRNLEYNNVGITNTINSVANDIPGGTNFGNIIGKDGFPATNWLSNTRAFDYLDFVSNGLGIEYAIVLSGLEVRDSSSTNPVYGWVIADDLHFPTCIPWQGANVGGQSFYEYFRSVEGGTKLGNTDSVTTSKIYAETPYGEYVNQFFTNTGRTNEYTPASEENVYINFQLDVLPQWTKNQNSAGINLRWSSGFDANDGVRLEDFGGVKSTQTTPGVTDTTGFYATSRIKID